MSFIKQFIRAGLLSEKILSSDISQQGGAQPAINPSLPQGTLPAATAASPQVAPAATPPAPATPAAPDANQPPAAAQTEQKKFLVSAAYHTMAAASDMLREMCEGDKQLTTQADPEAQTKLQTAIGQVDQVKTMLGEMYKR